MSQQQSNEGEGVIDKTKEYMQGAKEKMEEVGEGIKEQGQKAAARVSPKTRERDLRAIDKNEGHLREFLGTYAKFGVEDVEPFLSNLSTKQWHRLLALIRGDKVINTTSYTALEEFYDLSPAWLDPDHTAESKVVLFDSFPAHKYLRVIRIQTTKVCAGHAAVLALHFQKCILSPPEEVIHMPDLIDLYLKLNAHAPNKFLEGYLKNKYAVGVADFLRSAYGVSSRFKCIFHIPFPCCSSFREKHRRECQEIMDLLRTRPAILSFSMGKDFRIDGKVTYTGEPTLEAERVAHEPTVKHAVVLVGARKEGSSFFFLAQNFWYSKVFVEFSAEYLSESEAEITFVMDSRVNLLDRLHGVRRCTGLSVETEGDDDEDEEVGYSEGEDEEDKEDSEDEEYYMSGS